MPKFDTKFGPHLSLTNKDNSVPNVVPLNGSVLQGMLIKNSRDLSDEEYVNAFISAKTPVVEDNIRRTYAKGFEVPSAVQSVTIPELIQRKDVSYTI